MIARMIRIEGKVQGVFFRDGAIDAACAIGVSGWVCNRADGSVEVYAVGDVDLVERFTARLREGSSASRVDRIDARETVLQPVDGFTRRSSF